MIEPRVLTSDDWELWRELRLASLVEAPEAFGATLADWQGEGDREEHWRSRLELPGSYNIVAVLDGTPAGMVSGVPTEQDDIAELITMWVSPGARGRGVGDFLIREVERWARRRGVTALWLSVAPGNTRAENLYRRNGFQGSGAGQERQLTEPLATAG
ncbi:GNAT family N-acetyltransferase [Kitasatospora sp. NPDC001175]|uniref:GNAT family N-acetyltransferase n=1 Tax=Kitasatospora sp. NPDC001175 TaxID=3157103 RepID=UPI003CFD149D